MAKRISTDGGESMDNSPFAGLDSSGLPKGPKVVPAHKAEEKVKSRGRVEVRREKAGRGGKTVTSLSEFPTHIPLQELDALAFDLKKACASGGTLKGRVIELQGDVRERAVAELEKRGFKPILAGG